MKRAWRQAVAMKNLRARGKIRHTAQCTGTGAASWAAPRGLPLPMQLAQTAATVARSMTHAGYQQPQVQLEQQRAQRGLQASQQVVSLQKAMRRLNRKK